MRYLIFLLLIISSCTIDYGEEFKTHPGGYDAVEEARYYFLLGTSVEGFFYKTGEEKKWKTQKASHWTGYKVKNSYPVDMSVFSIIGFLFVIISLINAVVQYRNFKNASEEFNRKNLHRYKYISALLVAFIGITLLQFMLINCAIGLFTLLFAVMATVSGTINAMEESGTNCFAWVVEIILYPIEEKKRVLNTILNQQKLQHERQRTN